MSLLNTLAEVASGSRWFITSEVRDAAFKGVRRIQELEAAQKSFSSSEASLKKKIEANSSAQEEVKKSVKEVLENNRRLEAEKKELLSQLRDCKNAAEQNSHLIEDAQNARDVQLQLATDRDKALDQLRLKEVELREAQDTNKKHNNEIMRLSKLASDAQQTIKDFKEATDKLISVKLRC